MRPADRRKLTNQPIWREISDFLNFTLAIGRENKKWGGDRTRTKRTWGLIGR